MPQVDCARCGSTGEGLETAPLPGEAGQRVLDQVCRACWAEWRGMQVKLINEYRLSPARNEHYEFLIAQMTTFLNLGEE